MTPAESMKLVAVLATHWDRRDWSEEKLDLYSRMIGDLDYKTAARAVYWLIQNYKWSHPPTVGEIRERAGIIDKRERDRLAYARNKAERRAIEDLREKGEDPLPKSVRELIQRVKSIPGAESGNGKEKAEPLSPAEIEARKRVLRQQASYLIEQERLTA